MEAFKRPIAYGMLIMGVGAEICFTLFEPRFFVSEYEMNFLKPVFVNDEIQLIGRGKVIPHGLKLEGK
ncbi:MaoC/PaaZ C-terminal domain-containing protein [Oceanobacillus salinisoli]|uniref:MaoC/PaaZ C-terminal domain-containing protein n=1 Tax=Oceanobacillus salinisoli TaxID=2678611 RepID=UPI0012E269E1